MPFKWFSRTIQVRYISTTLSDLETNLIFLSFVKGIESKVAEAVNTPDKVTEKVFERIDGDK